MFKYKNKILIATLGVLTALSVGYVVNSNNLGGGEQK